MTDEAPSLRMVLPDLRAALAGLPPGPPRLPPGYRMRTWRAGDEAGWADLMNTGDLGVWTVPETVKELSGVPWPQFDPAGVFLVTAPAGQDPGVAGPVASACAWLTDPAETRTGTLHMVCVHPGHRGQGLGHVVCLAVLRRFAERGFDRVRLSTEEWRLAAVKTYLRLGFQPLYHHPLHAQQWRRLQAVLNWDRPLRPIHEGTP